MKISLVFIALLSIMFCTHSSSATPIQVLISISKEKTSARLKNKTIQQFIKNGFSKQDFNIIENADQFALYQALNHPSTKALIWVSHGSTTQKTITPGMSGQPQLIDYRGDQVAPIFNRYSKNIRYLAVIGCNSEEALNFNHSKILEDDQIEKFIPAQKIIAQFAIKKAIRQLAALEINNATLEKFSSKTNSNQLSITRSIPVDADQNQIRAIRIMSQNQLIGVIPEMLPGEEKTFQFNIENSTIQQIKIETGQNIMTKPEDIVFGNIKIMLPNQSYMKLFSKTDGTPFGFNSRLFILP